MVRTLGIDYGERRIGVAISDENDKIAQPLETLTRAPGSGIPFERLEQIVRENAVTEIVVGLPLNMDGSAGAQAGRARDFGAKLGKRTGLAVEFLDERWTSREAERSLGTAGSSSRRQKRRRDRRDAVAATLILATHLERRGS